MLNPAVGPTPLGMKRWPMPIRERVYILDRLDLEVVGVTNGAGNPAGSI